MPFGEQLVALRLGHRRLVASGLAPHRAHVRARVQAPVATPARYAAPRAVVSDTSGTTTGTPSTSAWNCISQAFATAPPSAFSSSSRTPAAASIALTASTVW